MDKSAPINDMISPPSEKNKLLSAASTPLSKGDHNIQYGGTTDEDVPLLDDDIDQSKTSKCLRFLATLTIEPATFFFMFAFMLNMSCLSNLMMDKGCLYHFNYTKEVCSNLSAYPDEKKNVEILSTNYSLYGNTMSLIAACAMIFIAPWSDKYGRKTPLVIACTGVILTDLCTIMCVIYFESSLVFLILCRLPSEIVGGFICFLTIIYSHAAEVTTEKNRTLKYTTIEISFMVAMALGGFAGGMIYKYYGYFYVYLTGLVLHVLSVLWVILMVEETAGVGANASWNIKRRNFFRVDSISKSWKATVKPREDKGRVKICMYILSMGVVILTYEVFGGLGFVYAHHIYNWGPTKYQTVNTVFSLSNLAIMAVATPLFLKVFKLSDPVLGVIGTLSMMGKNALISFAKYKVLVYYIGNAAGFLSGFTTLAIRTGLSKVTPKEETGLVFSFLATCEAIFPTLGSTLCTQVFNATIDVFPSVIYLISVVFLLIPLSTFVWLCVRAKRPQVVYGNINA